MGREAWRTKWRRSS